MAFLNWSDKFSVHNERINDEHKKLIILINALHEAIKIGKGNDVVGKILLKLVDYTKIHFAHEESLMREHNYPMINIHKNEHNVLTQQVHELYVDFLTGKRILSMDLMNFLKKWLRDHILGHDLEFGDFLHKVQNKIVEE